MCIYCKSVFVCPITIMRTSQKTAWGAAGEIPARKATEECVAMRGMTGWGCPAPVIWKVLHLSPGPKCRPSNWGLQISIMWADRICPSKWAAAPLLWMAALLQHPCLFQAFFGSQEDTDCESKVSGVKGKDQYENLCVLALTLCWFTVFAAQIKHIFRAFGAHEILISRLRSTFKTRLFSKLN